MSFSNAEIFGVLSLLVGFYASGTYIVSILRHRTKPHLFSWAVWGLLTLIGFLAQIHDGAGPGAWAMGLSVITILIIVLLSFWYGEKNFTRSDKIAFASALIAIVPWLMTEDPFGSVLLISLIDLVAFYPTFRKSWHKPYEEHLTGYNMANLKFILALFAMNTYTVNTTFYMAVCVAANLVFVAFCLIRRWQIGKNS